MKILLTTLNSKFVHSNLALRYLKAGLENEYEAILKEYTINDNLLSVLSSIYSVGANVVCFSSYIWNIEQTYQICENLKKISPGTVIVLGGPEVSYSAKEIIKKNDAIDFIISGEGEESLPALIKQLSNNSAEYQAIPGICFRDKEGNEQYTGEPNIISDLSLVPSPFQGDLSIYKKKVAYYESSRGCPYNCSYCLSSTIKGVRYFPIDRVKEELLRLIQAEVKQIKFVDRTFNSSKKRALDIWQFIVENNINTIFHFEISAHLLDNEVIDYLVSVPKGIFEFEIGVQSTNKDAIDAVGRKTDFEKISKAVKTLRERDNIHLHLDLIAGLPYEDYTNFGKSFDDVYSLKPHKLQLGFLKLLKGSRIRTEHKKHRYKFTGTPPYEVLENQYISFAEIMKIKRIEELLEIYKNSERFEKSLKYIQDKYIQSPFKMFEVIYDYFQANNFFDRKISQEEVYDFLYEFFKKTIGINVEVFADILKFDYIVNNFGASSRYWQAKYEPSGIKNAVRQMLNNDNFVEKYVPNLMDMPMPEKNKRLSFEFFGTNIDKPEEKQPICVLFERNSNSRGIKKSSYKIIDKNFFSFEQII